MSSNIQRYVYKISSSRLRKSGWSLALPLNEARRNGEIVSLADSQVLRWMDELSRVDDTNLRVSEIRRRVRAIKKEPQTLQGYEELRRLYLQLDLVQCRPDYLLLVIDRIKDYRRACKGFFVNGIKYVRLLGTNGGIKNSTIVFVSTDFADEIRRRIECGRDERVPLVTAKLEAYKALTCSASTPVSFPRGVLVVKDYYTEFKEDVILLRDGDTDEPICESTKNYTLELKASDGYGLMSPALAKKWSEDLNLGYITGGVNIRCAFTKGMCVTFDFMEYADRFCNGDYMVVDAWGDKVDIRTVELILTTSMLKLWNCYENIEHYMSCLHEYHYTFSVSKVCPESLESERSTNYQFLQSYTLTDDDISELVMPTVDEIKDVLGGDWRKTVLYLTGGKAGADAVKKMPPGYAKAIMAEPRMIADPHIKKSVYSMIRKRIDEAKIGVINVHGNYSIACGDPFALCQSIFGHRVTGLLKRSEIYNGYWADQPSDALVCFRAPMTCMNNIRKVTLNRSLEATHWYRFIPTCTVFNSWDSIMPALNGMDYDGDQVMLTDNDVLVRNHVELPALICEQRNAVPKISRESDFVDSNIASFGNAIGATTNWVTSMFEVRSRFPEGGKEYEMLSYRILCGQLYQQNAIDKAKGIICNPMPKEWHDRYAALKIEDDAAREFYCSIVVDKKPYFMKYVYPDLMRECNNFEKTANRNTMVEFDASVKKLKNTPLFEITERQAEALYYYEKKYPVGVGECTMNRICRMVEGELDGYMSKMRHEDFDYSVMKSGIGYNDNQKRAIVALYSKYSERLSELTKASSEKRIAAEKVSRDVTMLNDEFKRECTLVSPDPYTLCDIILDVCYARTKSKAMVWNVCPDIIVENLLNLNGREINVLEKDSIGNVLYKGENYLTKKERVMEACYDSIERE